MAKFTISIVSHRSGHLISNLLGDLRPHITPAFEIIVTINIPEDEVFLSKFLDLPIKILRNGSPHGFGENHNRAFSVSNGEFFVIVNPDIRMKDNPFDFLQAVLSWPSVGACAPVVLSAQSSVEDSVRKFPTISRLARRVFLGKRKPDYMANGDHPINVDWVAGMFVAFRRNAFIAIGGFDTRYYMYFEDAEICRRLWKNGWEVNYVPQAQVVHDAQRASHRSLTHMKWHLRSAVRFLFAI